MRATTLEVAMLADVSGAYSAIFSVNMCDWTYMTWAFVTPVECTWFRLVNKTLMARPLNLNDLLWIMSLDVNLSIIKISCTV